MSNTNSRPSSGKVNRGTGGNHSAQYRIQNRKTVSYRTGYSRTSGDSPAADDRMNEQMIEPVDHEERVRYSSAKNRKTTLRKKSKARTVKRRKKTASSKTGSANKKNTAENRKRKITIAVFGVLAACAIVLVVLYLTNVIRFEQVETVVNNRTGVAYINYSDSNMIINSEGKVLEKSEAQPEDVPQLTGLAFTRIAEGDYLECEQPDAFDYAIKLVLALRDNDILVREINITEDFEALAYVNNIVIMFGIDEKTEIKAADLADFFDQVKDLQGTLHMEEVNDKMGYTFKQESENTAIIQENHGRDKSGEEETGEEETGGDDSEDPENAEGEDGQDEENADQEGGNEEYVEEEYVEEEYYEEPVYEEEYVEEPVNEEEYYEEPVYEEYYEEPVYEEQY